MASVRHLSIVSWTWLLILTHHLSSADRRTDTRIVNQTITLPENQPHGTFMVKLDDTGLPGCQNEKLEFKQLGSYFYVNPRTGVMNTRRGINREVTPMINTTIQVFSSCLRSRPIREVHLTIIVTDVNDNSPQITLSTSRYHDMAEMVENKPPGQIIAQVLVADRDEGHNAEVNCSIKTTGFALEELSQNKYQVVTTKVFDLEEQRMYKIPINCTDHGETPRSTVRTLKLYLLDENEYKPKIVEIKPPTGPFNITEELRYGSTAVRIYVTDDDAGIAGRIECHAKDPYNHFTVEKYVGADYYSLASIKPLNYEECSRYEVEFICTDKGDPPLSLSKNFTIDVIDINEAVPIIQTFPQSSNGQMEVSENEPANTLVGHVAVYDTDKVSHGKVNCSMQSPNLELKQISGQDGNFISYEILTAKSFDYEVEKSVSARIMCNDSANPPKQSDTLIEVNITDVNDHSPSLNLLALNTVAQVKETPNSDVLVAHLSLFDPDQGLKGEIICEINEPGFKLVLIKGMKYAYNLRTTAPLVHAEKSKYEIEIQCRDRGVPTQSTTKTLIVNVVP